MVISSHLHLRRGENLRRRIEELGFNVFDYRQPMYELYGILWNSGYANPQQTDSRILQLQPIHPTCSENQSSGPLPFELPPYPASESTRLAQLFLPQT